MNPRLWMRIEVWLRTRSWNTDWRDWWRDRPWVTQNEMLYIELRRDTDALDIEIETENYNG